MTTHMYTFRAEYIHTHIFIHTYIHTTHISLNVAHTHIHACKVQHVQRKSRPTDPKGLAQLCTAGVE